MEIVFDCNNCGSKKVGADVLAGCGTGLENHAFVFGVCRSCNMPSIILLRNPGLSDAMEGSPVSDEPLELALAQYDSKIMHVLPEPAHEETLDFLPEEAQGTWEDAEYALMGYRYRMACTSYRTTLELALSELFPEVEGTLAARITKLNELGKLPDVLKDAANHIRLTGNKSVHDTSRPTQEDAQNLREFTKLVFTYLIELPRRIQDIQTQTP